MRAGGAGIPGFYTATGVGTVIAEGKEHHEFDGKTYILERGIVADLAIVKAWKADETGNLVFRKTARNFNVPAATCGRTCVVEVEEIVPTGSIDPDHIHLRASMCIGSSWAATRNALNSAPCASGRPCDERGKGLGPQRHCGAGGAGTARRDLCEPWHRHPTLVANYIPRACM